MLVRILKTIYVFSLSLLLTSALSSSLYAQSGNPVSLFTPYTEISVPPGQHITYAVTVINNSDGIQDVPVSVSGLPRNWTHTLKAGSWDIRRIAVRPKKEQSITLDLGVPLKVNKGTYVLYLRAGDYSSLPLRVRVTATGTYRTELETQQPSLEGAAKSTFTYSANLKNATADTQLYALNAQAPPGWEVAFKADYKQVASVNVGANQTKSLTIDVNPPDEVPAGKYQIPVRASTGETGADLMLEAVVTGSYKMALSTPNGLLSTKITAGDEKKLPVTVQNTGSSALENITLKASTPAGWSVTFDPKSISRLPPGRTADVTATIKASKDAIAGDYVTSLQAQTPETNAHADLRVSVRTSILWGWLGVLIILLALGSVYYLFRKYGRR